MQFESETIRKNENLKISFSNFEKRIHNFNFNCHLNAMKISWNFYQFQNIFIQCFEFILINADYKQMN